MKSVRFGVLLTTLSSMLCMARGGGEHEHGEKAFEWAGIFETPESDYLWTAQKVNERYADATMILVALPVTTFTEETLHGLEEQGDHAMNLTCTDLQAGGTIVPAANTCYKLIFQQSAWQSLYNVDASSAAGIAFFAEHVPTEFEATAHYLKDDHGHDIEPKATIPDANAVAEEAAVDAGGPVLASVLVNLVTLIGVILLFPPVKRASTMPLFSAMLFAFAAGALLACAFFLLLFEATHLVATGWQAEVDVLWRWGAMILAGMVVPPVVETIFSLFMLARNPNAETPAQEVEEKGTEKTAEDLQAQFRAKARLVGAVVIGDFFHNLCDGFFIGAAFKGCGTAFGWSVAAGTILHELPQEVADFVVLTGPEVNFGTLKAGLLLYLYPAESSHGP